MKTISSYIIEKLVIDKNVRPTNHRLVMNDVFCEVSLYNFLPRRKQAEISIIMFYIKNLENNKVTAQQYFYNRGNSVFRVDNTVTIDLPEKNSKGIYVKKEKDKANWDKFTYYVNRDDGVKIIEHILDGDYSIFKEYDDNFDKEVESMKYDDSKWFKVKLKFLKDNKSAEKSEYILEKLIIDDKIKKKSDVQDIDIHTLDDLLRIKKNEDILGKFLKGKEYKTALNIYFLDSHKYLHIFRYTDMHSLSISMVYNDNSDWPNEEEWSKSIQYNELDDRSSARNLFNSFWLFLKKKEFK